VGYNNKLDNNIGGGSHHNNGKIEEEEMRFADIYCDREYALKQLYKYLRMYNDCNNLLMTVENTRYPAKEELELRRKK
jgi:hypothetical protein